MNATKEEVRKQIKRLSKALLLSEKRTFSEQALIKLENDPHFIQSAVVAMYWSLDDEVSTHTFIEKWSVFKTILLPVIHGDEMFFASFKGIDMLSLDKQFGIAEPKTSKAFELNDIDLVVIPGLAFDAKNNRLGRGKGYYDKALKHCSAYKIGLCFPHQRVAYIPVEPHDIKLDKVISA